MGDVKSRIMYDYLVSAKSSLITSYLLRSKSIKFFPRQTSSISFLLTTIIIIPRSWNTLTNSLSANFVYPFPVIPFFEKRIPNFDFAESRTRQNFAIVVKSAGFDQSLHSHIKYQFSEVSLLKIGNFLIYIYLFFVYFQKLRKRHLFFRSNR